MTDYVLEVRTWKGRALGARHFQGTVKGPHPKSCHGGTHYSGQTGKVTCDEGHEIPRRVEWPVEQPWTEERYQRLAAGHFEGDGPGQFTDEKDLVEAARARFLGQGEPRWWEARFTPGDPGDRLYYELLPENLIRDVQAEERWAREEAERRGRGLPAEGDLITEVPQPEDGARFYVTVIRNPGGRQRVGRLLGPYLTRSEAEGLVDDARRLAQAEDPATAFDALGVSKWDRPVKSGGWAPGILNGRLEAERAIAAGAGA